MPPDSEFGSRTMVVSHSTCGPWTTCSLEDSLSLPMCSMMTSAVTPQPLMPGWTGQQGKWATCVLSECLPSHREKLLYCSILILFPLPPPPFLPPVSILREVSLLQHSYSLSSFFSFPSLFPFFISRKPLLLYFHSLSSSSSSSS